MFKKIILLVTVAVFLFSCSDNNPVVPTDPNELKTIGTVKASIEGIAWTSAISFYSNTAKIITAAGVPNLAEKSLESINLTFLISGNEPLVTSGTCQCTYVMTENFGTTSAKFYTWTDLMGQYTFTEVTDTYLKGKFSFKGLNPIDNSYRNVSGVFYVSRK